MARQPRIDRDLFVAMWRDGASFEAIALATGCDKAIDDIIATVLTAYIQES